jgi:thiamine transporter
MQNLLLTTFAIDLFLPIAKWLVIGLIAFMLIFWLIVYLTKKENFSLFVKRSLIALFFCLLAIGLTCLILEIAKSYSSAYAEENWLDRTALIRYVLIPLTCLILTILISAVIVAIKTARNTNNKKLFTILGAVNLVGVIVCGILMAIYYDLKFKNDGYYNSDTASVNQPVLYISVVLLIISISALAFILDRSDKTLDTKCLSFAGITIAMSFGLSYIKLFEMPQGGSVTLFSLLPIMIFSYIYGTKKGVLICLIYGILQAVQDPWIIHPAQFLLDYPIAFSAIGLSGMFSQIKRLNKLPQVAFLLGGILSGAVRFLSHVLSGVFAFEAYAAGLNPWLYSLAYNSFVFVDLAIVLAIGAIVFSSKAFIKELKKQ